MSYNVQIWTAMVLSCLIGVCGCEREGTVAPGDVAEGEVAAAQSVTVRGEVEKLIDERSFTMSGTAEIFSDDLVVVSRAALPTVTVGDEIEVIGTVRKVDHIEIEQETNWKFNPQVTIELADVTGYLVADSVRVVERD